MGSAAIHRIDSAILAILGDCAVVGNNVALPPWQLERKAYEAVNKVLELMGGKWNRKLRTHVFPESPADLLDTVILTGEITDKKKQFQFYETPRVLAQRMVDYVGLSSAARVLEPSAGHGAILRAIGNGPDKVAIELDPANISWLLRTGLSGLHIHEADFLTCFPDTELKSGESLGLFDAVIMNPPFTRGQDVKHILHARKFLNPGGTIVAICANGPREQRDLKPLVVEWEELPVGTFAESGTNVSTVLIVMDALL